MEYIIQEIEADDEFYAASPTHSGEYRVVDQNDRTIAEGFTSRCEALDFIDEWKEETK